MGFLTMGFLLLIVIVWQFVCFWQISKKAGYSGWWSLIMIIPFVGLIFAWIFPFMDWPVQSRLRAVTRGTVLQNSHPSSSRPSMPAAPAPAPEAVTDSLRSRMNNKTSESKVATPITETSFGLNEDAIYEIIANEMESGKIDKGLWTRLFAECGGDEKQMKVLYIKQRAERLISAERLRLEQAQAMREGAAETMRLEELQLQSLEQEEKLVPNLVTPQPAATNIPSAAQLQNENQQNDESAGWILMAVVVGIALLTVALMQVK
jgi:hypothetical protein